MIPSRTSISASRLLALNGPRSAVRQPLRSVRFNSTTGPSQSSTVASASALPLVAGLAGGGIVLVGGYAYYHFSGIKDMVNSAQSVHQSLKNVKDAAFENAPAPNEIIQYFRGVAKSYGALIPGASSYIDASFDRIEELQRVHKDEVNAIVSKAYNDIQTAIQGGGKDAATAAKVLAILRKQSIELGQLASKVGADVIGPLLDKHPEVKEKMGGEWSDLRKVVNEAQDSDIAQKAQAIYNDTVTQLTDHFKKGFSADAVTKARSLIEQKSKSVKDLSEKATKKLWEKDQQE